MSAEKPEPPEVRAAERRATAHFDLSEAVLCACDLVYAPPSAPCPRCGSEHGFLLSRLIAPVNAPHERT